MKLFQLECMKPWIKVVRFMNSTLNLRGVSWRTNLRMFAKPPHLNGVSMFPIYNQINYKDMETEINWNNNIWKDTYGKKIFAYNKISNMIYRVKYNLVLDILERAKQEPRNYQEQDKDQWLEHESRSKF